MDTGRRAAQGTEKRRQSSVGIQKGFSPAGCACRMAGGGTVDAPVGRATLVCEGPPQVLWPFGWTCPQRVSLQDSWWKQEEQWEGSPEGDLV